MKVFEAVASDGPRLAAFFVDNPVGAGSEFVLDRSPDFYALLRLRGHSRTFYACEGERLLGTATALWDERTVGDATTRVGEFVDLRVASDARGGRAAQKLLAAVVEAFEEADVEWLSAVIGDENRAASRLVQGKAGLPRLIPLTRYLSVHMVALRAPLQRPSGVVVREAKVEDAVVLTDAVCSVRRSLRLAPVEPFEWPDPNGRHRAWIATGAHGERVGALVVWDGYDVRRIRVIRYSGADRLLRMSTRVLEPLGLVAALPAPGGAIRMWASRALWNRYATRSVTRALVSASLRSAAAQGVHILQLNLPEGDPLIRQLPRYPRSTFYSTLFGAARRGTSTDSDPTNGSAFYADLAMV